MLAFAVHCTMLHEVPNGNSELTLGTSLPYLCVLGANVFRLHTDSLLTGLA
jgi:hypothetical protein